MTRLQKLEELLERVRTRGASPSARVTAVRDALQATAVALNGVASAQVAVTVAFLNGEPLGEPRAALNTAREFASEAKSVLLAALEALRGSSLPPLDKGPDREQVKKDTEVLLELVQQDALLPSGYIELTAGYVDLLAALEEQLELDRFKEQLS